MDISQYQYNEYAGWEPALPKTPDLGTTMVLVFGGPRTLDKVGLVDVVLQAFPEAKVIGCTTAGEILGPQVRDDSLAVTAVRFYKTRIEGTTFPIGSMEQSHSVGTALAEALNKPDLKHVFVLSDGLKVNGSELSRGLADRLSDGVAVTGGLAGDGADFSRTLTLLNGDPEPGQVIALGFYGDALKVSFGTLGGWDSFGPERLVTRSEGNILYELDGGFALDLYKKYLGEHAKDLPASGLLFPLSIRQEGKPGSLVRTILAVDKEKKAMAFAGDIPQGSYARLMKANFDRLVDGAADAAQQCRPVKGIAGGGKVELAILISCVGRKLILNQRVEEEVEAVRDVLGEGVALTGFYSYGEISPLTPSAKCELHNQTMTITTFGE
jgi:hypothetical protein